ALDARYARVIGAGDTRVRWSAGVDLQGRVESSTHSYADPSQTSDDFQFAALTLGPFVRLTLRPRVGAVINNDLCVPVAGIIDYPYSDDAANGGSPRSSI